MLGIFLPTYKRPGQLARVAKNIEETTFNPFTLYFGIEKDDPESYKAAKATGHKVYYNKYSPSYSNTVQTIYEKTKESYVFCANDDFEFLKDWDKDSIDKLQSRDDLMVCGIHDGYHQCRYYTLHMIKRQYIEEQSGVIGIPNRVFYPYNHNYADTEFTLTAIHRGVWDFSPGPSVIHKHHSIYPHVVIDATYLKNDKTAGVDGETYRERAHLWGQSW